MGLKPNEKAQVFAPLHQRWKTHHPKKKKKSCCKFINWEHVTLDANSKGMVCLESFCLLVSYFGSD